MLSLYFTQQLSALYVQESQRKTQDEMLFDQESVLFEQEAILFDWLHKTGCELLGCEAINPDSGLHQAGLTSLLAIQFCQSINHFLGCHLNVADLFAYPTLRQLTLFYLSTKKISPPQVQRKQEMIGMSRLWLSVVAYRGRWGGELGGLLHRIIRR